MVENPKSQYMQFGLTLKEWSLFTHFIIYQVFSSFWQNHIILSVGLKMKLKLTRKTNPTTSQETHPNLPTNHPNFSIWNFNIFMSNYLFISVILCFLLNSWFRFQFHKHLRYPVCLPRDWFFNYFNNFVILVGAAGSTHPWVVYQRSCLYWFKVLLHFCHNPSPSPSKSKSSPSLSPSQESKSRVQV